jgi:hypothetical protein
MHQVQCKQNRVGLLVLGLHLLGCELFVHLTLLFEGVDLSLGLHIPLIFLEILAIIVGISDE